MTEADTGSAAGAASPDPDHEIDLKAGKFEKTSAADLRAAFNTFTATGSDHLCVFFHGGLVSRDSGIQTARDLVQGYADAGAYPFFFIWNSDLLTVIEELLRPYRRDPAFVEGANRVVVEAAKKVAAVLNLDADLRAVAKTRSRATPMDLERLARFAEPYDNAWSQYRGAQLPVSPQELTVFEEWLLDRKPAVQRRAVFTRAKIRGPRNPFARVIERLNSGHGHGLYTTVIEELYIALGLAEVLGEPVWGQMKADIDAAFTQETDAGGTAFLQNLGIAWKQKPNLKVTLIGHSAGAIYLQRFVEVFDDFFVSQPARQVEVVTLAAALSFERMNQGLSVLQRRASGVRMFGLSDKREGGYWEVPGIYNKSLLYIVSSLCEGDPEADKPLVGMQRYWSRTRPYDQPYINAVTDFVRSSRTVWSPSGKTAPPGFQSGAKRHVGFPIEKKTDGSVRYGLNKGIDASNTHRRPLR
jgi:hypothetical protein